MRSLELKEELGCENGGANLIAVAPGRTDLHVPANLSRVYNYQ
jgi:hypothetical protein